MLFGAGRAAGDEASGTPAADWDAAFTRSSGWTGADAAGTVDLLDGRVLWAFGDTWIGPVVDNRHAGATIVNNSLAIQPAPRDTTGAAPHDTAGRAPRDGELRFFWGAEARGRPLAWLAPAAPAGANDPGRAGGQPAPADERWYWFTGGGVVGRRRVGDGRATAPQLALFLFDIARRKDVQDGVWSFEGRGSVLATIDDFAGDPSTWRVEQRSIPLAVSAGAAKRDPALQETAWGMAALVEPRKLPDDDPAGAGPGAASPGADGQIYIYGVRSRSSLERGLLVARVPADRITDFDAWTVYAGGGHWSPSPGEAVAVAANVPTELSVERIRLGGQSLLAMIHSEPPLGDRVLLRVARRPEGPWSQPTPIFRAPEPARDRRFFAYAAKGHAPLSAPGELLVSYVVNSHDFWSMAADASIYRPRLFRFAPSRAQIEALLASVDASSDAGGGAK